MKDFVTVMRFVQAIDALIDNYNSIDTRVAAYFHDDVWKAAYLILRFRQESVREIELEHIELLRKTGTIDNNNFRVRLYAFPISDWDLISNNWSKKFICLEKEFAVNFSSANELNTERRTPLQNYYEHMFYDWNSYSVETKTTPDGSLFSKLHNHDDDAMKIHFHDIFEYLSIVLQIERNSLEDDQGLKMIIAPIFFNLKDVIFEERKVNLHCKGFPMGILNVVIDFYNVRQGSNPFTWKDRIKIKYDTEKMEDVDNFVISEKIPEISINEGFKISVHRENGILIHEKSVSNIGPYWPSKSIITNPIYPIFKKFVSLEDIQKMIFQGQDKKGKQSSRNFEQGVSWILSLLGLNAIWLGDEFQFSGTGPDKASIDLLGKSNTNTILLVNATMGVPDISAFAREKRYREKILQSVTSSKVKIISVLFSNASVGSLQEKSRENEVNLIGKEELENIISLLEKGDAQLAKEFIVPGIDF